MPEATAAADSTHLFLFFHSVLRWVLIAMVAVAGIAALVGRLRNGPVFNWQRGAAIWAMVLGQAQLVLGVVLYGFNLGSGAFNRMLPDTARYWRYEHAGMMLLVVALVTTGRLASKRARTEQGKHLRVAVFYLLALLLLLVKTPWWFTAMGEGRGWI
ncbi:MAG: hypothetical protein KBH07_04175 [Flavobacteriales bacterium]|nr:hypothetical protein [Flavobacteriales bacterium]MBP9080592.1 hypothetical protein [Flavobacteriales bacterium]